MSDTADSTLNALKALIAAFQTGATPVTVKASTAEAASLPPKFPGPDDKSPRITLRGRKPNTTSAGACRRAERRPKATIPGSIWKDMSGSLNINRTKKRNRAARPACISACSSTVPVVMKRGPMKFMARVIRR